MMFNFSSISKSLDRERLPKKKIELLINFLEQKKMSPHFFLNDKTFLVTSKKSNFSIRENLDFNTLFSNNEILQYSRVLKHLKSNLFNDSKVELLHDGYIVGLKLKSNFIGALYLFNPGFNKKDLITALENFKIIFQLILIDFP